MAHCSLAQNAASQQKNSRGYLIIKILISYRADFKLIAKALARIGNAYKKLNDLEKAKTAYEKALTEHRTPEYRTALSEVRY